MQNNGQDNQKQGGLSWSSPNGQPSAQQSAAQKSLQAAPAQKETISSTPKKSAESKTAAMIGWLVAGIVVGALITWGWSAARNADNTNEGGAATTTSESVETSDNDSVAGGEIITTSTSGAITVVPEQDAGLQVAISRANVSKPTWVVVYENRNGVPGNALGATLFFPETKSGAVQLLRGTLPGQTYFVGESLDDGDRKFSLQNDKPVRDGSGTPVWSTFKTN